MSLELSFERIASALEALVSLAQGANNPVATPGAEVVAQGTQPVVKAKRAKPGVVTPEEKAAATVVTSESKEPVKEAKKLTDVDVRKVLQEYAATFPENGTKEARALMVKSAQLSNKDAKIADLPEEKYDIVIETAKAETAKRKSASTESL